MRGVSVGIWCVRLARWFETWASNLHHLIAGTRIFISGLVACLAELLLPVECTDFNVPDLLIPSGLKPGRDRFAGLPVQVDSAVHFSAHSATFAGVATCRRLTRPGGSCCAHLQPTSSCSPASLVSTGSSGTIPCYVAASRGSDDDGAAGNIYSSEGSL